MLAVLVASPSCLAENTHPDQVFGSRKNGLNWWKDLVVERSDQLRRVRYVNISYKLGRVDYDFTQDEDRTEALLDKRPESVSLRSIVSAAFKE